MGGFVDSAQSLERRILSDELVQEGHHEIAKIYEESIKFLLETAKETNFYVWGQPVLDHTIYLDIENLAKKIGVPASELLSSPNGIDTFSLPNDVILKFRYGDKFVFFTPGTSSHSGDERFLMTCGDKYINFSESEDDNPNSGRVIHDSEDEAISALGIESPNIIEIDDDLLLRIGGNAVNSIQALLYFTSYPNVGAKRNINFYNPYSEEEGDAMTQLLGKMIDPTGDFNALTKGIPSTSYKSRRNFEFIPVMNGQHYDRIYVGDDESHGSENHGLIEKIKKGFDELIEDPNGIALIHSTTNVNILHEILENSKRAYHNGRKVLFAPTKTMMKTAGKLLNEDSVRGQMYRDELTRELRRSADFTQVYNNVSNSGHEMKLILEGAYLLLRHIRWDTLVCNDDEFEWLIKAAPKGIYYDKENPSFDDGKLRVLQRNLGFALNESRRADPEKRKEYVGNIIISKGSIGVDEISGEIIRDQEGIPNNTFVATGRQYSLPDYENFHQIVSTGTAGDYFLALRAALEMWGLPESVKAIISSYGGTLRAITKRRDPRSGEGGEEYKLTLSHALLYDILANVDENRRRNSVVKEYVTQPIHQGDFVRSLPERLTLSRHFAQNMTPAGRYELVTRLREGGNLYMVEEVRERYLPSG